MQMLDNSIILTLIVLAFIAGHRMAGKYYKDILAHHEYTEKLLSADKGLGYIAPPEASKTMPIGQPFMDKLKENGRATQALK